MTMRTNPHSAPTPKMIFGSLVMRLIRLTFTLSGRGEHREPRSAAAWCYEACWLHVLAVLSIECVAIRRNADATPPRRRLANNLAEREASWTRHPPAARANTA